MTLPINEIDAPEAAKRIARLARQTRNDANFQISRCDAGSVPLHDLVAAFLPVLASAKAQVDTLALVDGVGEALEARYPGKTFVGDTEIGNFSDALGTIIAYIVTQIPKETATNRWILTLELVNNTLVQRVTTNGTQIGNLKTALETFTAVFDVT